MLVGAYCPRYFTNSNPLLRSFQPSDVAQGFGVPQCQLQAERGWFGMNAVRSANHQCILEFLCPLSQNRFQVLKVAQQQFGGLFELDRQRRVENIGRSHSEMNE